MSGTAVVLVLLGLGLWGYSGYRERRWVGTDDAFVTGHVIPVEVQAEGTVVAVLAENTQSVAQGQVLVRLDGHHAGIALQQAQAELAATVRQIAALQARQETLARRIAARTAALEAVRHDLARFRQAGLDGAVSEQQQQNATDKILELEAAVGEVRAEQKELSVQLGAAGIAHHPAVEAAKQRFRRAALDFRRQEIRAPVSGAVAKRKVQVGDRVAPGVPVMVIVPLDQLWVEANVLEGDLAGIRPGQAAEIRVDAHPDRVYHGWVEGLNPGTGSVFALLPTDNATGNFIHIAERVPVRIALDPQELARGPLQPGLSTYTRIALSESPEPSPRTSLTETKTPAYRTSAFDRELDGLEATIARVVAENSR
ncbi:HlyD family efflux transporter periplasmic adaptor subunit [Methylolobus aquaticus]|nr:HlyD family efflux transporter periplasmic adaptor subunit [Methylolobus aquaticus]